MRAVEVLNPGSDLNGCFQALYLCGIEQHVYARVATPQNVEDVLNGSTAWRGDDTDVARQHWNGFLAGSIEQTLSHELGLQLLKRHLKGARAFGLEVFGEQLQV